MHTVLVVDDHAAVRRAVCELFGNMPECVCDEAGNGKEAIEKARKTRPDVVILDFAMPEMNGMQAAQALHEIIPGVPMYLLTVHGHKAMRVAASLSGITSVFSKSEDLKGLVSEVCAVLRRR